MPRAVNNPFHERVAFVYPSGCNEWIGTVDRCGYGVWRGQKAHRVAYTWAYGGIADGMYVDHLCRNRRCVNVDHLRIVTPQVNALENTDSYRAKYAARTHCSNGHELPDRKLEKDGNFRRRCKICLYEYHANRRASYSREDKIRINAKAREYHAGKRATGWKRKRLLLEAGLA